MTQYIFPNAVRKQQLFLSPLLFSLLFPNTESPWENKNGLRIYRGFFIFPRQIAIKIR